MAPGTALRDEAGADPAGQHRGADRPRLRRRSRRDLLGGFRLDVPFSATRLRELAKMDGAIILDAAADTMSSPRCT
jgi:diadenylate cyclase